MLRYLFVNVLAGSGSGDAGDFREAATESAAMNELTGIFDRAQREMQPEIPHRPFR